MSTATAPEHYDVRVFGHAGYREINVRAGRKTTTHVVPPAGEAYAYDRDDWAHTIAVSVSPAGRSVRVWLDNREIKL